MDTLTLRRRCLAFFTLVCLKEFTRRRYGRLSIAEIPGIPESLTIEEKLGFERLVEEIQRVDFDKPNYSDFDGLACVSVLSIASTARDFLTQIICSQSWYCVIRLVLTGSLARMTPSISILISFISKVTLNIYTETPSILVGK